MGFSVPKIKRYDNGFTLVVDQMPARETVSFEWWVRAGSGDEKSHQRGAAHFLEHMLFTQGESADQTNVVLLQEMERLGGYANAFTTYDHTGYECCVPAIHWQKGLAWLSSVVGRLDVTSTEFNKEKQVVAQEQRDDQQQPSVIFEEQFWQKSCPGHPMGHPILGLSQEIQALSPEALREFYQTHYQPNRMTLSVAGPVSLAQVEAVFASVLNAPSKPATPRMSMDIRDQFNAHNWVWRSGQHEHLVQWVWPVVGYGHPDAPRLELMASVLGGGSHSWLHQQLRLDRSWVRGISASVFFTDWGGLFCIDAYVMPNHVQDVINFVRDGLRNPEQISQDIYAFAASDLEKEYLYNVDTPIAKAKMNIMFEMFFGGALTQQAYYAKLKQITKTQGTQTIEAYLQKPFALGQWLPESDLS